MKREYCFDHVDQFEGVSMLPAPDGFIVVHCWGNMDGEEWSEVCEELSIIGLLAVCGQELNRTRRSWGDGDHDNHDRELNDNDDWRHAGFIKLLPVVFDVECSEFMTIQDLIELSCQNEKIRLCRFEDREFVKEELLGHIRSRFKKVGKEVQNGDGNKQPTDKETV